MGTFSQLIEIASSSIGPFTKIEALVDTGATYMLLPRNILESLGIKPLEKHPFTLANGNTVEYDISTLWVRLDGRVRPTVCVWGEPGSKPLLGSFTLEAFLLGVDPVKKSLVPVSGYLV